MPTDDQNTASPQDEPDTARPPRTVNLSDLTPAQRALVLALIRAAEEAETRKLANQQADNATPTTDE